MQSAYHVAMRYDKKGFTEHLRRYGRSPGTIRTYQRVINGLQKCRDPFERLNDDSLSPKYRALNRAVLSAYCKFKGNDELLRELSLVKLPPPRRLQNKQPLTDDQWKALRHEIHRASYLDPPVRAEIIMLVNRGFRCGDVLRLRATEVKQALRSNVLNYQAKGGRRLEFSVTRHWKPALACFDEYFEEFEDDSQVWELISDGSQESAHKQIAKGLVECGERVGVKPDDMHPHLLRKTYATRFYNLCKDPLKLRDHMQWASIETAMLYVAGADRAELDDLAEGMFE